MDQTEDKKLFREQFIEFLKGGFAPNVILLREFSFEKAGIILDGLHFSAWILIGHIRARQKVLLDFIKEPDKDHDLWPEAQWPENYQPNARKEWDEEIDKYEKELQEVIKLVNDPATDLFIIQKNGKTISWATMTLFHHTGYHIGQLKTIGRQLGVW